MPRSAIATLLLSLALAGASGYAAEDRDPHATGARPPTPEEQAWLDDHTIVVDRVYPNALAVQRLNAERAQRGLPPLPPPAVIAKTGQEFTGASRSGYNRVRAQSVNGALLSGGGGSGTTLKAAAAKAAAAIAALPAVVDNSATRWYPPIGNQGNVGSCVAFGFTYAQLTYQINKDIDRTASGGDPRAIFSPQFTMSCSGTSTGGGSSSYQSILGIGAPSLATMPYVSQTDNKLPTTAAVWREAMRARATNIRNVMDVASLKQELANGNVLAGVGFLSLSHCECIVGYDDSRHAFKVANSWGTGWGNQGFSWFDYNDGSVFPAFVMTTQGMAKPLVVAEVTVKTNARDQFQPRFAVGAPGATVPTYERCKDWRFPGPGTFAYDGGTAPSEATLAFNLTDLAIPGTRQRFFLFLDDSTQGLSQIVTDFKLTDGDGNLLATLAGTTPAGGLPRSVDKGTIAFWADLTTPAATGPLPSVTVPSITTYTTGVPGGAVQVTATELPRDIAVSGLPIGAYVSGTTIVVPFSVGPGTYPLGVLVANAYGATSANTDLVVTGDGSPAPVITSGDTFTVTASTSTSYSVLGTYPITATNLANDIFSPFFSEGLNYAGIMVRDAEIVVSTFVVPGTYTGTIGAYNHGGVGLKQLTINVLPPTSTGVPQLYSSMALNATVGQPVDYRLVASNSPTSFAIDGLPPGLSLDRSTGAFTGTPTAAGVYEQTLSVSNGSGSSPGTRFVITINGSGSTTAPTITAIANQTIAEDAATAALAFTVDDAETIAGSLTVTAASSNTALVPASGLVLGGSGASRTVKVTPAANANGSATITVTVSDGSLTASQTFTVAVTAVNDPPVNTAAPAITGTAQVGQTLTAANGTWNDSKDSSSIAGYAYQWQRADNASGTNLAAIASATAVTYVPVAADAGKFLRVQVTATDAGTPLPALSATASTAYTAAVSPAASEGPAFSSQPAPMTKRVGLTATFTAAVSGTPTPTIQWQRSPNGSSTWTAISGATATTYTTATLTLGDNGARFRAVASNSAGSATSTAATLTVRRRGDVNMDGAVDISDLILVKQAFGGTAATSDLNGDGAVDISDLILVKQEFGL